MTARPLSTVEKGELAFLKCATRAVELRAVLSRPTTDARYDAVLDIAGALERVQVKYCDCKSSRASNAVSLTLERRGRRYTKSEIDVLLVYIPTIDKIVRLTARHFAGKRSISLRLGPTKNGQSKGVRTATDFLW